MKWISVKDKLPQDDADMYLVATDKGGVGVANFIRRGQYFSFPWSCWEVFNPVGEITDWMPMPQPPQKQEKEMIDLYAVPHDKWIEIEGCDESNCLTYLKEPIWVWDGLRVAEVNCYKNYPADAYGGYDLYKPSMWMRQFPFDSNNPPLPPQKQEK